MEFRKPVQILVSKEETYKKWKKVTAALKSEGLHKNIIATFMMEDFLGRIEQDREGTLKKVFARIK